MTRREEILRATLDLAAERGLGAVTLSQIADRVGIRKPSLYNHFASKDEILQAAYQLLRDQARVRVGAQTDLAGASDDPLEEILLASFERYRSFVMDEEMLRFFKVLYAGRSISPVAAQIMVDETERMVSQVKTLFYALSTHGQLRADDVDMVALSYAMTVHALVDLELDLLTAGGMEGPADDMPVFDQVRAYISWFAQQMEAGEEGPAHA